MKNKNLNKAKKTKNDEFYTQLGDISNEMNHYRDQFKDKIIFLNCDDPEESMFWLYFELNFDFFGLKKLVATHYDANKPTYKLELSGRTIRAGAKKDNAVITKTPLKGNGDFRSPEAIEILKECDMVVTNPPFSLFREFIAQIMEHKKQFIVIGTELQTDAKDIFPFIINGNIWLGVTKPKKYEVPEEYEGKKVFEDGKWWSKHGNHCWFTNLKHKKINEDIILYKEYNKKDYPTYDNYNAIESTNVRDIPQDYYGVIGVPVSFLLKHNPKQFEIIGHTHSGDKTSLTESLRTDTNKKHRGFINGMQKQPRILIKRKITDMEKIEKFMEEIDRQGVMFHQDGSGHIDLLECDKETFIEHLSCMVDRTDSEDKDLARLSELLPNDAGVAMDYWELNNK